MSYDLVVKHRLQCVIHSLASSDKIRWQVKKRQIQHIQEQLLGDQPWPLVFPLLCIQPWYYSSCRFSPGTSIATSLAF